ncbi:MAG TPA: hypothetical protein VGS80_22870 [Ktedonobacterales bacterium]|nr:hypothetical protein [Ktedonobacterales bacterium]
MTPARAARRYDTALGLAAGLVALAQAAIAGSVALSTQASVLSLQQALVPVGGTNFGPFIGALAVLFAFFYLTAGLSYLVVLGICWYAGRVAALLTGDRRAGGAAGLHVSMLASAIWTLGTLIIAVVFHADGSFAWLIATLALFIATPAGRAPVGVSVIQPGGAFLAIQVIALLLQALVGAGIALAFGMLAGRIGASSGLRRRGRT